MQNRTEIVGVSWWERGKQLARTHRPWLEQLGAMLAGYIMAGSTVLGGVAPFGTALCAAVPRGWGVSAAAGAVLGYTFSAASPQNMKYIVAVLMVVAARWLFEAKTPGKYRLAVSSAIAVVALTVASAAVLVLGNATIYDVVMAGAELFLVCGATYFFAKAITVAGQDLASLTRSDLSCLVIALAVALMGISSLQIGGFSVGRVLATVAVLLCARYGREGAGAVGGVTAGVALGLAGGNYTQLLTSFGLGGLVSGIFGGMGRIATAASFIFINTIVSLFTMQYNQVYASILEVFAASVIFVALPHGVTNKLTSVRQGAAQNDTTARTALCDRLEDISAALMEIGTTTQQVSERLGRIEQSGYAGIYTRVAEQVCLHCGMKTACWQFRYSDTVDSMEKCVSHLKREGTILKSELPKRFSDTCCKVDEFTAAINTQFQDYVARQGVQRKVSKVRAVVTDQFEGMSLMLGELAAQLGSIRVLDPLGAKRVEEYFLKEGITPRQVVCTTDEYDRLSVELQIPNNQEARLHRQKSTLDLCTLLEADLEPPTVTVREKYASVCYEEKACFTVELGASQIPAGGNRLCGDAYEFIRNKGGQAHMILSDGMGSGGSAAVDSAMATGLITRLISVGVGYEAALKMVNSALLIKSGEESLATIDICSVDLFTGKAAFYKAGAAPTYVLKNGKAGYVESTSLPAGILRGVSFERSGITLHEGDTVVMVSDGVIVSGTDWVKSELECNRGYDMQRLCEKIANTAKMRRQDGRQDDITVLAAQVLRGS